MADNRRFDTPVDTDRQTIGKPRPYGNQFEHNLLEGWDEPIGTDPNSAGTTPVYPDWWTAYTAQDD